ncbi:hypothetical protein Vadar_021553 [Vaccinium darrowii]|uniref:Uncharacterized protein n=1 Tax=Vaccinium darrowii TaxID=229202 RepID=A0ACB7YQP4_9ERIC|nr:hypothetical protein Vadar_021553 [Vaccinium darrowii]
MENLDACTESNESKEDVGEKMQNTMDSIQTKKDEMKARINQVLSNISQLTVVGSDDGKSVWENPVNNELKLWSLCLSFARGYLSRKSLRGFVVC